MCELHNVREKNCSSYTYQINYKPEITGQPVHGGEATASKRLLTFPPSSWSPVGNI